MDLTILTTFFCLILLVLHVLALNELMILKRKVNAHLDRTDLHTDKLHTILSILQQIEAKQDLIFNNASPSPGEPQYDWGKCSWKNAVGSPEPVMDNADMGHLPKPIAGHFTHTEPVFPSQWGQVTEGGRVIPPVNVPFEESRYGKGVPRPPKKRGRPKKAS